MSVAAVNGYEIQTTPRYAAPIVMASCEFVKILINLSGIIKAVVAKIIPPVNESKSPSPSTFLIFFISLFPMYCEANTPLPLSTPNTSNTNTKKYLFAKPTPAMALSPNLPIITVSIKLTIIFNNI